MRQYSTALRRLQRIRKTKVSSPKTPKSKTEDQIRKAGLTKLQGDKVRRQLLLGNALVEELKISKESTSHVQRGNLHKTIAGKIMKRYRCIRMLSQATGMSRNKLLKVSSKLMICNKHQRFRETRLYRARVIEFLERYDNSRVLPGKSNSVKHDGTRHTTRVLTDYLASLHQKFLDESSGDIKLLLASFCRIRPKYIRTISFITRYTCLCTKHQNMALTLKSIRREGVSVSSNPESIIDNFDLQKIKDGIKSNDISLGQWRRVQVEEKTKQRW
ncbi:hypothetical protein SNE40_002952 [Patella caerulea]|uniref:Uncharacterized protein n=1 Tax=Patella caerulea TaxID=87958 RepID=A0AAN8KF03_PATCE